MRSRGITVDKIIFSKRELRKFDSYAFGRRPVNCQTSKSESQQIIGIVSVDSNCKCICCICLSKSTFIQSTQNSMQSLVQSCESIQVSSQFLIIHLIFSRFLFANVNRNCVSIDGVVNICKSESMRKTIC